MYVDDFPACCGAAVVTDFPYNKACTKENLHHAIQEAKARDCGMLFAILNPQQMKSAKVLQKSKFSKVAGFVNPVHDSKLVCYKLNLNRIKKDKEWYRDQYGYDGDYYGYDRY